MSKSDINHEKIHLQQQKELLLIGFYLAYIFEYLLNLYVFRNKKKAYRSISFEKEAYKNENNELYCKTRKIFGQWRQ